MNLLYKKYQTTIMSDMQVGHGNNLHRTCHRGLDSNLHQYLHQEQYPQHANQIVELKDKAE